ncbi:MAG: ethanolamine ammonia-lyase light chain EutC [Fibrobacteres bacterium]|jgi:ethanolamine ammonia-lyase small subunit|nr:ethanolamine ammonia-lyase light chain EutC [Fibrobacterota bacterium]
MGIPSRSFHRASELSALTPARIDRGRAGTRPRTAELLLFRADHAAARDAVLTELPDDFPDQVGCVASQAPILLPPLLASLESMQPNSVRGPVFVRNARVGVMNHLGELAQATVVVLLVGERPGLSTSKSLSVYMGWMPRPGCTYAHRNVISNIHEQGLVAQQAATVVTRWVAGMFRQRTSGAHFSA